VVVFEGVGGGGKGGGGAGCVSGGAVWCDLRDDPQESHRGGDRSRKEITE